MSDYSEKSDFEINKLVALAIGIYYAEEDGFVYVEPESFPDKFNPVNNPADSWKLMADNEICLMWNELDNNWHASEVFEAETQPNGSDDIEFGESASHENPGRAVAICFLMIKAVDDE